MSFFLFSCLKQKHEIRVKNGSNVDLQIKIGPTDYGTISANSKTEYLAVPKGRHDISGSIDGSVNLDNRGKHKYTLNISITGFVSFREDPS